MLQLGVSHPRARVAYRVSGEEPAVQVTGDIERLIDEGIRVAAALRRQARGIDRDVARLSSLVESTRHPGPNPARP